MSIGERRGAGPSEQENVRTKGCRWPRRARRQTSGRRRRGFGRRAEELRPRPRARDDEMDARRKAERTVRAGGVDLDGGERRAGRVAPAGDEGEAGQAERRARGIRRGASRSGVAARASRLYG